MKTIATFIAEQQLTMTATRIPHRPDNLMNDSASHYVCTIKQEGHGNPALLTCFYSMGSAHKNGPQLADVLDSLSSEASMADNARDYRDFADENGYDEDSRKGEKVYLACCAISRDLESLIGRAAKAELLNDVERL